MKKYKLYFNETITEVEVERETNSFVFINGVKESKNNEWCSYHDTYEDAYRTGINNHVKKVEHRKSDLQYAIDKMNEFNVKYEMTKP